MTSKLSLCDVNDLDDHDFISTFGNVVEKTPLCAAVVCTNRPFSSFTSLTAAMCHVIDGLRNDAKAGILRCYLDLIVRWES